MFEEIIEPSVEYTVSTLPFIILKFLFAGGIYLFSSRDNAVQWNRILKLIATAIGIWGLVDFFIFLFPSFMESLLKF